MVMSGITQVADFATEDNHINQGEGGVDKTWAYLSVATVKNDKKLVEQARQNLRYQLFAYANSAILNVSTTKVATWWDNALTGVRTCTAILACAAALAWIVLTVLPEKKKGDK